jgi:hypothetical protein
MSTITFNTLKFAQRLEKAGATREYAIAEAEALSDVFETGTQDLATKADILAVKADIKSLEAKTETRLAEVKLDLIKWIVGLILGQTALLLTILPKILGH